MSNTTNNKLHGVLYFTDIHPQIDFVKIPVNNSEPIITDSKPSGVLTLIEERQTQNGVEYAATLWDKSIINAVLDILAEGVSNPAIWLMGEYSSADFEVLNQSGLLPQGISLVVPSAPKLDAVILILRLIHQYDIILPGAQGFGHMVGVRIAVFPHKQEPMAIYNEWLSSMQNGRINHYKSLLTSDTLIPDGAVGWLAPFGEEDRNNCLLYKEHLNTDIFALQLSQKLGLPLFTSHCDTREFQQWEDWHILPSDVHM